VAAAAARAGRNCTARARRRPRPRSPQAPRSHWQRAKAPERLARALTLLPFAGVAGTKSMRSPRLEYPDLFKGLSGCKYALPRSRGWETCILPLNYGRTVKKNWSAQKVVYKPPYLPVFNFSHESSFFLQALRLHKGCFTLPRQRASCLLVECGGSRLFTTCPYFFWRTWCVLGQWCAFFFLFRPSLSRPSRRPPLTSTGTKCECLRVGIGLKHPVPGLALLFDGRLRSLWTFYQKAGSHAGACRQERGARCQGPPLPALHKALLELLLPPPPSGARVLHGTPLLPRHLPCPPGAPRAPRALAPALLPAPWTPPPPILPHGRAVSAWQAASMRCTC
jgi:hypothetical protein